MNIRRGVFYQGKIPVRTSPRQGTKSRKNIFNYCPQVRTCYVTITHTTFTLLFCCEIRAFHPRTSDAVIATKMTPSQFAPNFPRSTSFCVPSPARHEVSRDLRRSFSQSTVTVIEIQLTISVDPLCSQIKCTIRC